MGTRSITVIKDANNKNAKVMEIYRQYDGYLDGHGIELAEILTNTPHNGVHCLTASIIGGLKQDWGNIYVYAPTDNKNLEDYSEYYGAEFYYEVIVGDNEINLTVWEDFHKEPVHTETITPAREK